MHPTCDGNNDKRADHGSTDDRQPLVTDNAHAAHHTDTCGDEKETKIADKKIRHSSTWRSFTTFRRKAAASKSIPIMEDGTGTPVAHTMSSPTARKANSTAHCVIITNNLYFVPEIMSAWTPATPKITGNVTNSLQR